ncbi:MAG: Crp/Fnr family transcriptional regulator [Chitinophagales bacterium]
MDKSALQETLKSYFPALGKESLNVFMNQSSFINLDKGTILIAEGKRHHYFYLILKGGVKSYYLKDGKSVCMWFAEENEIIGTTSTLQGFASKETIELLEDSELIRFHYEKIKDLAQTNLSISNLLNELWAEHALFLEERLYQLQFMTAQERYEALLEMTPSVLQKVSLTDIASYLGISRETLSRIRGKK